MDNLIICKRHEIEGIGNLNDIFTEERFIHFFEWLDKPMHYLIIVSDKDASQEYELINRINRYDESLLKEDRYYTYLKANISKPISIGSFEYDFDERFLDFIKTNYVVDKYMDEPERLHNRGWYFIERLEPERWLNEFIDMQINKSVKREREEMKVQQLNLF
jgi:hypothetical protein